MSLGEAEQTLPEAALADLDVLGADAAPIVKALRELGLAQRSTVVDLGCGKRGVAIVRRVEISRWSG